jgi:single-strand DNA-binding protein
MIGIEGSIQTRRYQDKDGNNRTAFEVIANNVQFVESKREEATQENSDSLAALQDQIKGLVNAGDLPF